MLDKEILNDIVAVYGSQSNMARSMNVSRSYISLLMSGKQCIPAHRAMQIEEDSMGMFEAAEICCDYIDTHCGRPKPANNPA